MKTLVESCLVLICAQPQGCLQREEDQEGEASFSSQWLRGRGTERVACAPSVEAASDDSMKDPWVLVRRACVGAARRGEARPQVACALGSFGRLVDGLLPSDYWEDLRCDALSLAGSRAGPGILRDLARAQSRQETRLVALDLGGCLLIDDDAVAEVARVCVSIQRLGLRDCRKLTDATVSTAAGLPQLVELDLGGDFNMTARGIGKRLLRQSTDEEIGDVRKRKRRLPQLRGLGVSGLGADDTLLDDLRAASEISRLGLGYGRFSTDAFALALASWTKLLDLRVQWTTSFTVRRGPATRHSPLRAGCRSRRPRHHLPRTRRSRCECFRLSFSRNGQRRAGRRHARLRRRPTSPPAPPRPPAESACARRRRGHRGRQPETSPLAQLSLHHRPQAPPAKTRRHLRGRTDRRRP